MPADGIRCIWTVLEIKETKWGFNSLNRTMICGVLILMFKSIVKNC
jgi:hypothetical protein